MKTMHVKLTLTREMLGMWPSDDSIFKAYIAENSPNPEATLERDMAAHAAAVAEVTAKMEELNKEDKGEDKDDEANKGPTVLPRMKDGTPCLHDYQIKGFFKDAAGMLKRCKGEKFAKYTEKMSAFKKVIDGLIFPQPDQIPIVLPEGGELGVCRRTLRTSGPKGERTALAVSETAPAGCTLEFDILLLSDALEGAVREWLDYGCLHGLGQWRNASKGTFTWEDLTPPEK